VKRSASKRLLLDISGQSGITDWK